MGKKLNGSLNSPNKMTPAKKKRKSFKFNIHRISEKKSSNQRKKCQNSKNEAQETNKSTAENTSLQKTQKDQSKNDIIGILEDKKINDYYEQERINFNEDLFPSEIEELQKKDSIKMAKNQNKVGKLNFRKCDRIIVLVQMYKFIRSVQENQVNIPDNFYFSSVALLDDYLEKTNEFLTIQDLEKIMVVIMIILAKLYNIMYFNSEFKNYLTEDQISELEIKIIDVTDLELEPIKSFDYFECIYSHINITEKKNQNENSFKKLMRELKEIYKESTYLLTLDYESNKVKCSTNFVSCMFFTYGKLTKNRDVDIRFLSFMNQFLSNIKRQFNYSEKDYIISERIFKWSLSLSNCTYNLYKDESFYDINYLN